MFQLFTLLSLFSLLSIETANGASQEQALAASGLKLQGEVLTEPSDAELMEASEHLKDMPVDAVDGVDKDFDLYKVNDIGKQAADRCGADTAKEEAELRLQKNELLQVLLQLRDYLQQKVGVPQELWAFLLAVLGFHLLRFAQQKAAPSAVEKERGASISPPPSEYSAERSPSTFSSSEETDDFGCTKLHRAASHGETDEVEKLLKKGSSPDAREAWDETPLHFAARAGKTDVCKMLLIAGASVDALNADDKTPLLLAAQSGHEATCELLLDAGAGAGGHGDDELPTLLGALLTRRVLSG